MRPRTKKALTGARKRALKSKWFYCFIFFSFALTFGYARYQRYLFIPDDPGVFQIHDYSLSGDRPFYQTVADRELTDKLVEQKQSQAFRYLARRSYDLYRREYGKGRLLTQYVKVGPDQFGDIDWMVNDACDVLGVKDVPDVYVGDTGQREIVLTNLSDPSLIICPSLLSAFSPDELRFLLAREIAHIRCDHVLLLDMIRTMRTVMDAAVPDFLTVAVFGSLGLELVQWLKEAEVSADRGALVVTGNIDAATMALIKLNVGVKFESNYGSPNAAAFARQIDDVGEERVTSAAAAMNELRNPNSFLTVRVRHLLGWYESNPEIFTEEH